MIPQTSVQPTPERIMRFVWSFAPPLILESAVETGLFDALENGPATSAEIGARTGASQRGLAAIADALVGMELLSRDETGRYSLSPEAATFLVRGKPAYLGAFASHISRDLIPRWQSLTDIVRTGRAARAVDQEPVGSEFFENFVSDLFATNYPAARAAAGALRVEAARQPIGVLDLAAGSGVWSIAIAQSSPHVKVTAVDWERVLSVTRRTVARLGLTDRYEFRAGDLSQVDFGSGYDIATLGLILHSEGEKRSRALLKKIFEALAPGGTIVIAEFLLNPDKRGPLNALIFNVNMLVNTTEGAAFSFDEIRGWLEEAGFVNSRLVEAPAPSPLIFANKPGA